MELNKDEKHIKMLLEKSIELADDLDTILNRLKIDYSISKILIEDEQYEINRIIDRSIKDLDNLYDKQLKYKEGYYNFK
jgi:hypothetical protein